jgi:hypothetical protein
MTASALVKQSDLRRLAAVVKDQGVCVEVDFERKTIRIMPDIPANHSRTPVAFYEDIDL